MLMRPLLPPHGAQSVGSPRVDKKPWRCVSVLSGQIPFSEADVTDSPASLYAATKKSNELLAHSYSYIYGISVTGLRFFTVYGPWGRPDMAAFSFTRAILKARDARMLFLLPLRPCPHALSGGLCVCVCVPSSAVVLCSPAPRGVRHPAAGGALDRLAHTPCARAACISATRTRLIFHRVSL